MDGITIGFLNLVLAIAAALFTYYKFFREGSHRQRIEFDIDISDLGIHQEQRIVEIQVIASNKGHVEQKFDEILLRIKGINEEQKLTEIKDFEPRLCFPEEIDKFNIIPNKYNYYFVRPGVTQVFSVTVRLPKSWCFINTHAKFKYFGLNQVHTTEHSFCLGKNNA